MTLLLDIAYAVGLLLAAPYLVWRLWRQGPRGAPLREYFGRAASRRVASRCVWIHGVSLGEINAARTIVQELRTQSPDVVIVISATTRTGLDQARSIYPDLPVIRFPLDFSFAIRTLLTRIRPSVIVLMELEAWPNLIEIAHRRQIPVLIANGRVTGEKSMRRFSLPVLRSVAKRMFGRIRWVGAQDATYAERFKTLGVPSDRIEITGSVKYDTATIVDHVDGQEQLAKDMGMDCQQPLWVCGSTGPEEEAAILDAFAILREKHPTLQLAIIPRKPERFEEVAQLIVARGFPCLRRSTGRPTFPRNGDPTIPVFLGDTMGELRKYYALATVVFVGRTLVRMGGSDLMEVAALAKPMVFGPHVENFAEAATLLLANAAARQIDGTEELPTAIDDLLSDPTRAAIMGQAAREAVRSKRGATGRIVQRILECSDDVRPSGNGSQ